MRRRGSRSLWGKNGRRGDKDGRTGLRRNYIAERRTGCTRRKPSVSSQR